MRERTITWVISKPLLRVAGALALAVGSFVALRQRYHGDCIFPDYDPELFLLLPVLFLIAFVWLISELACPLLSGVGMRRLVSIALGLATYAAVAGVAWALEPSLKYEHGAGFRALMSVFWSVGFLLKTGNFSDYSCGY
jgi:hypothetical protein